MIEFGRFGEFFVIINRNTASQMQLTRKEAKATARFLMKELNIVSATLKRINENGETVFEEIFEKDKELLEWLKSQK